MCCWTARAGAAEVKGWEAFAGHALTAKAGKPFPGFDSAKTREEKAFWVLLLRTRVYKSHYQKGMPKAGSTQPFEAFRRRVNTVMVALMPEIRRIQGYLAKEKKPITRFKSPEKLLAALPREKKAETAASGGPGEGEPGGSPGKKAPAGEGMARMLSGSTETGGREEKEPADPLALDDEGKEARFPKLTLQGFRSVHYRYLSVSGNESQFRSLNGLSLLPDKVEQRTDLTVTSPPESKTKVNARFYEFPNQEQELDIGVEHGPLKLRGGIFNANFQTGTWAVLSKKIQGLQANVNTDRWGLGMITSQERSVEAAETFKGNNSKGPYRLQKSPIVEGSLVLRLNGQAVPDGDVTIDYFLGQVTFRTILGPDDVVEANYEEELLFATSGQESRGLQGWFAKGPWKVELARLSQDAGAAGGGGGNTQHIDYECGIAAGSTPRCDIGGPFFCPSFNCLQLPDDLLVKGSETVELVLKDDRVNDPACLAFAQAPETAYRAVTNRGYAQGLIDFEVAPGAPALACAKGIKVSYDAFLPSAVNTITKDYTETQFNASEPLRLETNYQGSELVYFCRGGVFENCDTDPLKSPDEFDGFANGSPDYEINPATQEVRFLQAIPFPSTTAFYRVVYRSQPSRTSSTRRFEKQVTDAVFTWTPNEKFKASYEMATSTSDIGRKPLKVLNERINVATQATCEGAIPGSLNETVCGQVINENVVCISSTDCALQNGNIDPATLSVVVTAPTPVNQQLCSSTGAPPAGCQVIVDVNTGALIFRTALPDGVFPTASYRFFRCKGSRCRLSQGNVLADTVVLYKNDTLNEANKLVAFLDFTVTSETGVILFSKPLGNDVQTLVATYDYNLAANFNTVQDGNATNLELRYDFAGVQALFQETSKDTVFAGFGIENNLDTLRRNMEAAWTSPKGFKVDMADRTIETALDIQKLNVRTQKERGWNMAWQGKRGIELTVGTMDRSLVDDLPVRVTDEGTKTTKFGVGGELSKWARVSAAKGTEDFTNRAAALTRTTDNWKVSLDAKPSGNLTLRAMLEENSIDTNSPTLSYSSVNSVRQLDMDYRAFKRMNIGVAMDTQDTRDSRPGQPSSQQNTIRYGVQMDPFWKFATLSMEITQQDTPSTTGGKTRTETMNLLSGLEMGKQWLATYTLLSTELSSPGSSSTQDNQIIGLKYTGLSRLKGNVDYTLSSRGSSGTSGNISTSGGKWALRLFYLQSERTSMSLQVDLDNQNQTDDSTILFDILQRKSDNNKLKYSAQFFDTGGDLKRQVYEVGWIKRLTRLLELNTQARYSIGESSKTPGNDNQGFLLSTELKADFK